MSKILAIDTSTEACSCALNIDGDVVELFEVMPRQHANKLLPMIERLMKTHSIKFSELDAIAVGKGPGSFTGLRIAAGVAQGLAFASGLPIIPVSTLETLAFRAFSETSHTSILSCIDARINEVYWGLFSISNSVVSLVGKENLSAAEAVNLNILNSVSQFYGVGSGMAFLEKMDAQVQAKLIQSNSEVLPHALDIALLAPSYFDKGLTIAPEALSPTYLRDKVTHN